MTLNQMNYPNEEITKDFSNKIMIRLQKFNLLHSKHAIKGAHSNETSQIKPLHQ